MDTAQLATAVTELNQKKLSLPEDIQELLDDDGFIMDVYQIAADHRLDPDLHIILLATTENLLIGLLKPQEYVGALTENLSVPREVAAAIARDINTKIFHDVKDALLQVHGLMQKKAEESATAPTTPNIESTPITTPTTPASLLDQKLAPAFTVPQ